MTHKKTAIVFMWSVCSIVHNYFVITHFIVYNLYDKPCLIKHIWQISNIKCLLQLFIFTHKYQWRQTIWKASETFGSISVDFGENYRIEVSTNVGVNYFTYSMVD